MAELELAQTELQELRAAGERFDAEQSERQEEEQRSAAELGRLHVDGERLRAERDRLLDEAQRWTAVVAEERKKLSEFLLDALGQIEQVSSNGSAPASDPGELHELQERLQNVRREPFGAFEVRKVRDSDEHSF